ncbi:MAG: hypothetical protein ABSE64_12975 [Vulcanimicrobiaceae bacterium]|jgi:hypothetical protein
MAYEFASTDPRFQRLLARAAASPIVDSDPWMRSADKFHNRVKNHWDEIPISERQALHAALMGQRSKASQVHPLKEWWLSLTTWLEFVFQQRQSVERSRKIDQIAETVQCQIAEDVWTKVLADHATVENAERARQELLNGDKVEL